MIRKRLNRNIDASAIVDLPEINNELQQVKNDIATNTEAIDQLEQELARFDNYYTKPEIDEKVEQLESEIGNHYTKPESDAKFATITQIDEANTQIAQNQQSIETLDTNTAKLGANNTFSGRNSFSNQISTTSDIKIFNDKKMFFGWNESDVKLELAPNPGTKDVLMKTISGKMEIQSASDVKLNPTRNIDASTKPIVNVANPTNNQDAATKAYVDGLTKFNLPENTEVEIPYKIKNKRTYMMFINKSIALSNSQEVVKTELIDVGISDFGACSLWANLAPYQQLPYFKDTFDGYIRLIWESKRFKIQSKNAGRATANIYGVITYCK